MFAACDSRQLNIHGVIKVCAVPRVVVATRRTTAGTIGKNNQTAEDIVMRNILFKSVALGILLVTSAQAATNFLDFNTDPVASGLYTEPGGQSATWIPTG